MNWPILDGYRITFNGSLKKHKSVFLLLNDDAVVVRRLAFAGTSGKAVVLDHTSSSGTLLNSIGFVLPESGFIEALDWSMLPLDRLSISAPSKVKELLLTVTLGRKEA